MAFGKREKLIVGVIGALGAGAALHFLVYAPRAQQLEDARGNYENAKSELQSLGQPRPQQELEEFELETAQARLEILRFLEASGVAQPERIKDAENPDENTAIRADMKGQIEESLTDIVALRDDASMPTLSFLDAPSQIYPRRWDVITSPPEGMDLANVANVLNERARTLNAMSEADRLNSIGTYQTLLQQSGIINMNALLFVEQSYGRLIGTMTRLSRVQLLQRELEPTDIDARTPTEFRRQLEQMFLMEWEDPDILSTTTSMRQLEVLQDLLDMAQQAGVEDVLEAGFEEKVDIEQDPLVLRDSEEGDDDGGFGGGFGDGFGGPGGFPGGFPGGLPGDFGGGGLQDWGGMTQQTTEENEDKVAEAAPVVISVAGSHEQVMEFLHIVTSSPRFYTVDGLTMFADNQQDGSRRVGARATVYFPLSLEKAPLDMSEEELQEKIAEAQRIVGELGG